MHSKTQKKNQHRDPDNQFLFQLLRDKTRRFNKINGFEEVRYITGIEELWTWSINGGKWEKEKIPPREALFKLIMKVEIATNPKIDQALYPDDKVYSLKVINNTIQKIHNKHPWIDKRFFLKG
jgi:hypothetical protein